MTASSKHQVVLQLEQLEERTLLTISWLTMALSATFTNSGYTSSGTYTPSISWSNRNGTWDNLLRPAPASPIAYPSPLELKALRSKYPDWTFNVGLPQLTPPIFGLAPNSLIVRGYDAVGLAGGKAGADIWVEYNPFLLGNPNPIHWIQFVVASYSVPGRPAGQVNVDVLPGSTSPFYDEKGTANTDGFYDGPATTPPAFFQADLFVVTRPSVASKNVTILRGLSWGFYTLHPAGVVSGL
jgi:hypothetical protein